MSIPAILDHAAENSLNVLLKGKHGVGKTALVKEAFTAQFGEMGNDWMYFSASTMDPWVDFIGVPKEKTEDGVSFLELVRPRAFQLDQVKAIFFDELNRSHKKIRNAIMELIQFKSINGKQFSNLQVVWAAVNPDDDEELTYDVDKLDPAQLDRFELHIDVPYQPDIKFFKSTYGEQGALAVKWWLDQNEVAQAAVSPRRLEYALQVMNMEGDIRHVLTAAGNQVNVTEFVKFIQRGDPAKCLHDLMKKDENAKRAYFTDPNNLKHVQKELINSAEFLDAFAHLLPEETIMTNLRPRQRRNKMASHILANLDKFNHIEDQIISNSTAYRKDVVAEFQRMRQEREKNQGQAASKTRMTNRGRTFNIQGINWQAGDIHLCFTGTLNGYNRDDAVRHVESLGCHTTNTVNARTTHLVVAGNQGKTKTKAAQRNGVTVLTEDEFVSIFVDFKSNSLQTIEVGGKLFNVDELTVDNFLEKTGQRFRVSGEQLERINRNEITREDAFREMIENALNGNS